MSKYTGILCECCQKPFSDGDDVVVCPECGAPHHRECYKSIGHCALHGEHGGDFVWKAKLPDSAMDGGSVVCTHCNSVNVSEARYCIMCGTSLADEYQGGESRGRSGEERYQRSPSYEEETYDREYYSRRSSEGDFSVDGINSRELMAYTGSSFHYYLRQFKMILAGSAFSWNWGAFFFNFFYFFYRKMYKVGAALLLLRILAFLPAFICYTFEPDASMQMMGATVYYNAVLMERLAPVSSILNSLVSFTHILCAFWANKFYLKAAVRNIRRYKQSGYTAEGSPEYYDDIYYLGKPSIISVAAVLGLFIALYWVAGSMFHITF